MTKITRFAPSPTGNLHIGGVRTALFNYVYAKQNNGKFLIRIEDTDAERSTREFEENIINGLKVLNIVSDETPIRQSERFNEYQEKTNEIINSGKAYYCECSKDRLDEIRSLQQQQGLKPQYDGKCRDLNLEKSENTVLRLKTPQEGALIFNDLIRGEVIFQNNELDDLILVRSDGSPTYHLCCVIDDRLQDITTVIRGEDHLSNTARQIHIQEAFGYPRLEYAHLPLVLGQNKKRLSKRDSVSSVHDYFDQGYLPTSIINMLARLGWSGGDKEIFSIDDLIKDFRIQEVQKGGAIFEPAKLDWINTNHLAALNFDKFKLEILPFLEKFKIDITSKNNSDDILQAMRTSQSTLFGIASDLRPYFHSIDSYDEKAVKKFLLNSKATLEYVQRKLQAIETWDEASIDGVLSASQLALDLPIPKLNQPIRIAITGSTKSPSLGLTLSLFEKDEVIKRISAALKYLSENS